MTAVSAPTLLDRENPWPGLEAFEENAHAFFHGRDREARELLRHVLDAPITVLYGKSGLGKTSLLRAGLFPALRERHFLPIYVRFELRRAAAPLSRQLHQSVCDAIRADASDATPPSEQESLWEYLHRADLELWSARNHLLTPVIVLDQFEELFTLGERVPDLVRAFLNDLGDLAENRVPAELAARIDHDEAVAAQFDLPSQNYKLLISLREDFLPHLEGWQRRIPALGRSRMRLLPLQGGDALDAVRKPAGDLMTDPLARRVVSIIAGEDLHRRRDTEWDDVGHRGDELEVSDVDPPLLTLFCRELNEERKRRGQAHFDEQMVEEAKDTTLPNYYSSCVGGLEPRVAEFIETELITGKGFRNSYAREDAVPSRITEDDLAQLISSRLLRIVDHYGAQRIQLTHDVLTGVVREHRDRRLVEEQNEKEKAALAATVQKREQRRFRRLRTAAIANLVILTMVALAAAGVAFVQRRAAVNERMQAVTNLRAATAQNLNVWAQGMLLGTQAGGDVQAFQLILAADRLAKNATTEGALYTAVLKRASTAKIIETSDKVNRVVFGPDGRHLASASEDGTVRLWDAGTGQPLGNPLTGHSGPVYGVAFSPDGHLLASAGADGTVRLWDAATGQVIGKPLRGDTGPVYGVAFSPDGHLLASAGADGTVRLWDAAAGQVIGKPLRGDTGPVLGVAFSPDGRLLASASEDATVRLWDVESGKQIGAPLIGHTGPVLGVAFSPDGRLLASADADATVRLWSRDTGQPVGAPLTGHTRQVTGVAFSPDGRLLASASTDATVRLWDVDTGKQIGAPLIGHTGAVFGVVFSPDGRRLVSASEDATVRLWDAAGEVIGEELRGDTGPVFSVAFSPDGRLLASASEDGEVRLWEAGTGRPIAAPLAGHSGPVLGVAFSPDGHLLASASEDATVRLWDAGTGQPVGAPLTGHTSAVTGVAFSPDGRLLASASDDTTVRLWDAGTGQPVGAPLTGHTSAVTGVAFSPDGRLLASASDDTTVRLWPAYASSEMLCAKLTRNMSHSQWRDWVSPAIDYVLLCPDLPVSPDF